VPFGIDVVIVEPGPIRSEWNALARDGPLETSRGGAYEDRAVRINQAMAGGERRLTSSPPSTVAKKVVKVATTAVRGPVPRRRGAGTILRARKVLPDGAMDRLVGSVYR
jgi:NAD(P)-dependent dehydrogenase (short-subunit alcohol dehydrogenase family)